MQVDIDQLIYSVTGCAMKVHRTFGAGFLESVYENALMYELGRAGICAEQQKAIPVRYEGIVVGNFYADICIEDRLIVENKAVPSIVLAHELQLVNYLKATGIEHGLLLNFGSPSLQHKLKFRTPA